MFNYGNFLHFFLLLKALQAEYSGEREIVLSICLALFLFVQLSNIIIYTYFVISISISICLILIKLVFMAGVTCRARRTQTYCL